MIRDLDVPLFVMQYNSMKLSISRAATKTLYCLIWKYIGKTYGLVALFLFASAALVRAGDFTYNTNSGTVTITGYTGTGGVVNIPDTIADKQVTKIGDSAFYYCASLTRVTIPDSVLLIGDLAFRNCSNINNLVIGNKVTSIGNQAFFSCSSLTNLIIPDSVITIGNSGFGSCTRLSKVTIGNHLNSLINGIFSACISLPEIDIPQASPILGMPHSWVVTAWQLLRYPIASSVSTNGR